MIKNHIFQKTGLFAITLALLFSSCRKDKDTAPEKNNNTLEVNTVKDLNGLEKGQVYFGLHQGIELEESSTDWDIKIAGTTISFGNGASGQLVEGVLASYTNAPENGYSTSSITGNGPYYVNTLYNEPQHSILMTPGILIIVKTGDEKYAKLEMLSYYKGNPDVTTAEFANLETRPEKQHFTFNYVLQPDGSKTF